MNNLYTYNLVENYYTFKLYINKGDATIQFLITTTENQFKTIKNILFLKGIKSMKYYDTEITEEIFNLIKPYMMEMVWR